MKNSTNNIYFDDNSDLERILKFSNYSKVPLGRSSFYYRQRLLMAAMPDICWFDLEEPEQVLESWIDRLCEILPMGIDWQEITISDFGELYAVLRYFCRCRRLDQVESLINQADFSDKKVCLAFTDALCQELPRAWHKGIFNLLVPSESIHVNRILIASEVSGRHHLEIQDQLFDLLINNPSDHLSVLIWAAGSIPVVNSTLFEPLISGYLDHQNPEIRQSACLTLLKMGNEQVISQVMKSMLPERWPWLSIGLGGGLESAFQCIAAAVFRKVPPEGLTGLGLLGEPSAIPVLIDFLPDKRFCHCAAGALYVITGRKTESFFVNPSGSYSDWKTWWEVRQKDFEPGVRYRFGSPCSLSGLLATLKSESLPQVLRQFAYEELVVRYNLDVPFDTRMQILQQKQAISAYEKRIGIEKARFQDGEWYFQGKASSS